MNCTIGVYCTIPAPAVKVPAARVVGGDERNIKKLPILSLGRIYVYLVMHAIVVEAYPDLLFDQKSWIALNTGSFLFRNCQWSLDLLDAWAPMGPKGPIREEAEKVLMVNLKGRPAFEADDQSALIYLLLSHKDMWMEKVFVENSYYLHRYWAGLVDRYEEMIEKYHPGLGDERWSFVTQFVGCKPCGSYGDYPVERCLSSMERAFNFADNQVLKLYGLVAGGGGLR
ncbi:probable xyloglucan 6-xylosyltransferase 3 [Rosa rugosa]|uniref:probable xyloglucan 6-xylosyltransferase 3 n=1 Tax=Rosa rugosa TaxID=74645 RepID=UPI002B4092CB|nr:probable xyloglucan 6-xylosyltransferase 3 [Rosa rugosa]